MAFRHVLEQVFAELHGFVLCCPRGLDALHGAAAGRNLLELYTTTDEGDRASAEGAAIPLTEVEPDDYTIVVRSDDAEPWAPGEAHRVSRGWVLHAQGGVAVCGLGYLARWDPESAGVHRLDVPDGWYEVTARGLWVREPAPGAVLSPVIELVLAPRPDRPAFTADVNVPFDFGAADPSGLC